jgi:hypothetical protein
MATNGADTTAAARLLVTTRVDLLDICRLDHDADSDKWEKNNIQGLSI